MIWQHGESKLIEYLKTLNNCHPTIIFTAEYSLNKINVLDVEVIWGRNSAQISRSILRIFTKT